MLPFYRTGDRCQQVKGAPEPGFKVELTRAHGGRMVLWLGMFKCGWHSCFCPAGMRTGQGPRAEIVTSAVAVDAECALSGSRVSPDFV